MSPFKHFCSLCGVEWVGAHACGTDQKVMEESARRIPWPAKDLDPENKLPTPIPDWVDPPAPDPALDLQLDLEKLLGELAEDRRLMVEMLIEGHQVKEAARQLGLAMRTATRHLRETRNLLRAKL